MRGAGQEASWCRSQNLGLTGPSSEPVLGSEAGTAALGSPSHGHPPCAALGRRGNMTQSLLCRR